MAVIDRILASDPAFQARFSFLAKRFIAGQTIDTAIEAVRELNAAGMRATLDFLGEDVTDPAEAERTRDTYLAMLDAIADASVDTNVSVKLTALGLLIDRDLCVRLLTSLLERAARNADPFVRIDMEGSAATTATLEVFERVYATHRNVGPVIQAYLRRSPEDVERAIELGARVRLCKGAYREPESVAFGDMPTIRRQYMRLAEALLLRGTYPGIATHDDLLIETVKALAAERGIGNDRFEFQMLYGVRRGRQRTLVHQGYTMRVYVPFGTHWAGYFYRRIAERRENVFFALRSIFSR